MTHPDPNLERLPEDSPESHGLSRLARGIESLHPPSPPPADLARRAFEASRGTIRRHGERRRAQRWSWMESLRLPSLARVAMAASILLALAWAGGSWWSIERTRPELAEVAPSEAAPPAELIDESPRVSEPILVAMLGEEAPEWASSFEGSAGAEALAVLESRRLGIDDYAAEFEAIVGDAREPQGM